MYEEPEQAPQQAEQDQQKSELVKLQIKLAQKQLEQAPKKTVPEGIKLLYGTLEKVFFTWVMAFGTCSAYLWINLPSLSTDKITIVSVAIFMICLAIVATVFMMKNLLRLIKSFEYV